MTTKRLPLKEQLSWVVSATWTEDESGLLLTDVPHSSLLWYDLNGQLIARINAAPGSAPALIARARGGGYIGNRQDQIAWFDKQLTPIKTRSIRGSKSSNYLDLVLGWLPLESSMLFFGDIKNSEDIYIGSGLVKWEDGAAGCLDMLFRLDDRDPVARRFLQTAYPMLASVRNRGYMLVMTEKPYILEFGVETRPLKAFPPGLQKRPQLPPLKTDTASQLYQMLVESETVTALFGWEDRLYLLSRKPAQGGTRWLLWKIDPHNDVVEAQPSVLPTFAEHIVVVPGHQRWAIVEKGHVEKLGQQAVIALVVFRPPEPTLPPQQVRRNQLSLWNSKAKLPASPGR